MSMCVILLTRQTFSFSGLQQDGPLSVQVSWLAAFTQVGLRNVLPVDAHTVYMLPGTKVKKEKKKKITEGFLMNFYITV